MTQKITLKAALPADDLNGLIPLGARYDSSLVRRFESVPVVALLSCLERIERVTHDGELAYRYVMEISSIELVPEADRATVEGIVDRAFSKRTGKEKLPGLDVPVSDEAIRSGLGLDDDQGDQGDQSDDQPDA